MRRRDRWARPYRGVGRRARPAVVVVAAALALVILTQGVSLATFPGHNGWIAYVHTRKAGEKHIWRMLPDGSHARGIGPLPARRDPTWSADGSELAYLTPYHPHCCSADAWLRVMHANGRPIATVGRWSLPRVLSWSPDGSQIAFSGIVGGGIDVYKGIGIVDVTSGDLVFASVPGADFVDTDPAWSPDGDQIAFARVNSHYKVSVMVMDSDGDHIRRLTNGEGWAPDWAPDGSWLVFSRFDRHSSQSDIAAVSPATGDVTVLTHTARSEDNPVVSPDGTRILFDRCCFGPEHRPVIFMMRTDGTHVVRLNWGSDADWQPVP